MDKPSLELDTFQLSVLDLGLSLTVWTHLYTSDEATSQLSCEKLYGRVKNGQLWFLPPGVISVQIVVQLEHRLISYPCPQTVLEILEASIRESSVSPCPASCSYLTHSRRAAVENAGTIYNTKGY